MGLADERSRQRNDARTKDHPLNESTARTVLLIRAIEQNDPHCEILAAVERAEANRWASGGDLTSVSTLSQPGPSPLSAAQERFVATRAERLAEGLFTAHPSARRTLEGMRWRGWVVPLVASLAVLLGLATNALGPAKRINILAIPIMGMLLWNIAVYLLLLVRWFRSKERLTAVRPPFVRLILAMAMGRSHGALERSQEGGILLLRRSLAVFVEDWIRWGGRLHLARAARLLHLGAALLALGMIGGMYWRGLGFEYLAGWESTFLHEQTVARIIGIVLGPASMLTGLELPSAEQLAGMRWPGSPGVNAAPWIHLYAMTATVFIIVPRLFLALTEVLRAGRLQAAFPLPDTGDPYFHRVLSVKRGRGDHVRLLPCGFQLDSGARETLRSLLVDLLGVTVNVEYQETVGYGGEDEYLESAVKAEECDYLVVLFNLASTPEEENHGHFIDGLVSLVKKGQVARRLVLLLEESSYRQRLTGQAPERLEERRKAWRRLVAGRGVEIACLDLDQADPSAWADQHRHLVAHGGEANS